MSDGSRPQAADAVSARRGPTAAEWRRAAVSAARHSIEMEGGRVSDAAGADLDGYAAGELTVEEGLDRVRRRISAGNVAPPSVGG